MSTDPELPWLSTQLIVDFLFLHGKCLAEHPELQLTLENVGQ